MRIYLLEPASRPSSNIRNVARRLNIGVVADRAERPSAIVFLGNGTPDDIALTLLAHRYDGRLVIGVAKPRPEHSREMMPHAVKSTKSAFPAVGTSSH